MSAHARFRPFSRAMALEPRILFDGAAAVAGADALGDDPHRDDPGSDYQPASDAGQGEGQSAILLVVDARVPDYESLLTDLPANVQVRVVDRDESGVGAVGATLANGSQRYEAVHILSHGEPGSLTLGRDTLSLDTLSDHSAQLQAWGAYLTADADILLYGCDVAATLEGRLLINELAMWTGADIAASTDATGADHLGGDWNLGAWTGQIEAGLPFGMETLAGYGALLNTVVDGTLAQTGTIVTDADPLIGEDFRFKVTFDNNGTVPGYGPFVDLFVGRKGADGSATDLTQFDGLSIVSAQYLSVDVERKDYTLTEGVAGAGQLTVAGGQFEHPITGEMVAVPAHFGPGDQLVVLTLPFGSFVPEQPTLEVDVVLNVSEKADPNQPLRVASRGGYMFGKTALDDSETDPVVIGDVHELLLTPRAFTVDAVLHAPEGETATGPNFVREVAVTITPAANTSLSDTTVFEFKMPDGVVFVESLFNTRNALAAQGWVVVSPPSYDGVLDNDVLVLKRVDGQAITAAQTLRIPFYVTEVLQAGTEVIAAADGAARTISFANAIEVRDGQWQGVPGSNLVDSARDVLPVSVVESAPDLTARSVQVIKDVYRAGSGTPAETVVPGDSLEYRLQVDVSDFFRTGTVVVSDELPDGMTFDRSFVPTLTMAWQNANGTKTGTPAIAFSPSNVEVLQADGLTWVSLDTLGAGDPLPTQTADGKTQFRFNVSNQLGAGAEQLLGGLVNVADGGSTVGTPNEWDVGDAGLGATTGTILYRASVDENYRTDAPLDTAANKHIDHRNLKERDVLAGTATVTVDILGRADGISSFVGRTDTSTEAVSLPAGEMALEIASIKRGTDTYSGTQLNDLTLAPGDEVTYRLGYSLPLGDYENLVLEAYLPLPVFNMTSLTQDVGAVGAPEVNKWSIGAGTNTVNDIAPSVTVGTNNKLTFNLGDSGLVPSSGSKEIELFFTAAVTATPFADRLLLTTQGRHEDSSSKAVEGSTAAIKQIVLGQADVHVYKAYTGVVNAQPGAEVDGTFNGAGAPLTSGTIQTIGASNATSFDGGDTVRVTVAVENQGSSGRGAFDVQVKDTLDATLTQPGNLAIYRGNGAVVTEVETWDGAAWVVTTVSGNEATVLAALQSEKGIRFNDASGTASLARGKSDTGDAIADGSNIIYITYDATVKSDVAVASEGSSQAEVLNFANAEGSANFLATGPRADDATIAYRGNEVSLIITQTDGHADTDVAAGGATADAVIGEYIDYELKINLAEAKTTNGSVVVTLGSGLGLVNVAGVAAVGAVNVGYSGFDGTGSSSINGTAISAASGTVQGQLTAVTANSFTVNLGDIINADHDAGDETLTLSFRAIPLNTTQNNAGSTGADLRVSASFTEAADPATATVTVREPQLTATITADKTTVSADNVVEYTLTVKNESGFAAHDVLIEEVLAGAAAAHLTDLTITQAATAGAANITTLNDLQNQKVSYALDRLADGETFVVKFSAKVAPGTPFGAELEVDPTVTWTSLPTTAGLANDRSTLVGGSTADSERSGDDGVPAAGKINDYARTPSATVTFDSPNPVLVIDATSESSTTGPSDPDATQDDAATAQVAVGEIVRLRMVVQLPESTSSNVTLTPELPIGLKLVGGATVALVSDDSAGAAAGVGIKSSTLDQLGDITALQVSGSDPSLVNPTHGFPTEHIDITNPKSPVFRLGNVDNTDRDSNAEYVVIEFNVLVENLISVQHGNTLQVLYAVSADGATTLESDPITLTVVEPTLAVDKAVTGVVYADADPQQNSAATVTYTVTLTNNSGTTAHDVSLSDVLPTGVTGYTLVNAPVVGTGVGAITSIDGVGPGYNIASLANGASVSFSYSVALPDRLALPDATDASVTWTSLSGLTQTLAGGDNGQPGTAIGERTGTDGAGTTLNNYVDSDDAAFGAISGTVWDDTWQQNGTQQSEETGLAGVPVELWKLRPGGNWAVEADRSLLVTTTTDTNGAYVFGALPVGDYRVIVPATFETEIAGDTDVLAPRFDTDGGTTGVVGMVGVTVQEGSSSTENNFGYLRVNDAPVLDVDGGSPIEIAANERTTDDGDGNSHISAVPLLTEVKVSDIDLGDTATESTVFGAGSITVTLTDPLAADVLSLTNPALPGIDGTPSYVPGTGALTIQLTTGATIGQVQTILEAIRYAHNGDDPTNLKGTPRSEINFTVVLNDGNNSRGLDQNSGSGGAKDATVTGKILLGAVNDPPVATNDDNGLTNLQGYVTGNVRTGVHQTADSSTDKPGVPAPDSDPDTPLVDLVVSHVEVTTPGETGGLTVVNGEIEVEGKYGTLRIQPDGTYRYTLDPDNAEVYGLAQNLTLSDTFEYTLSDGHATNEGTDTATLTITITGALPGAPTVAPADHNGQAAAGDATVYESGLPDGTNADATTESVSSTIKITADSGLVSLYIAGVNTGDVNNPYNPTTLTVAQLAAATPEAPIEIVHANGTLYITGWKATAGQASAPRAGDLSYTYTLTSPPDNTVPADGSGVMQEFTLKVVDVLAAEATGTLSIYIVDDAPIASPDVNSVTKHAGLVSGNVFTGTGDNLAGRDTIGADGPATSGGSDTPVTHVVAGTNTPLVGDVVDPLVPLPGVYGTLTLHPDGSYTYVVDQTHASVQALAGTATLTDTYTYTITDADGDTHIATLTITISGNTPPVANPDVRTTPEDTPVSGNVLRDGGDGDAPDTDVEDDPLTVTQFVVGGQTISVPPGGSNTADIPGAGTIVIHSDGRYTFTPVPDWHGSVPVITYTVADDKGGEATTTLSITVTPVPDIVPDSAVTLIDVPVVVSPLDNDDFEGSNPVVSVQPGHGPSNGTVTVHSDGTITYTPAPGYTGQDTFTYTVTSGGRTETSTVTITVTNQPPVPLPDVNTVPEDTPATGNVLLNDSDPDGHPVTVTGFTVQGQSYPPGSTVDIPGVGTITLGQDGGYTFVPVPDWHGNVPPIGYTVTDGKGEHASSTLIITVTPVPDAEPDTATTRVDEPVTVKPLDNDHFEGDNPVVSVQPGDGPSDGTVTVHPDGSITYTPEPGFVGEDTFTYTVTSGGVTETTTVTITVVNQPPVALPDTNTVPEDTPATGNVLVNDSDPDGHPVKVTGFTVDGQTYPPGSTVDIPGIGTITLGEDGGYTFVPVPDWNGSVPPIGYTVADGKGGEASSTLTIIVTPVPDAVDDRTTSPGTPVTLSPLDNDDFEGSNPVVSVQPGDGPGRGTVTVNPDGSITYTPEPGFVGEDTFTYTVTSGGVTETATITVVVSGVADAPSAPSPAPWASPAARLGTGAAAFGVAGLVEPHQQVMQAVQLARSPVSGDQVRDASVFFDGGVFSKVPRMDMPFHPIVYVNREVQNAQNQREASDARGMGNPGFMLPDDIQSSSIGSGLGMDPNLFVQHMVRMSQQRAQFQAHVVDSRYGRLELGSDGELPVPSLFESRLAAVQRAQVQAAERASDAAADAGSADEATSGEASEAADQVSAADVPSTVAHAAPAFTEQLRSGASQLPGAVLSAVPPKVS